MNIETNFSVNFNMYRSDEVIIKLPIEMIEYVKYWERCMYDNETGMIKKPMNYKRDIIIADLTNGTEKVDTKFHGSFPKSFRIKDEMVILELNIDYQEIGFFPEIKQLLRDKKIDQILK